MKRKTFGRQDRREVTADEVAQWKIRYVEDRSSIATIATEFKRQPVTIRTYLRQDGVQIRPASCRKTPTSMEQQIAKLYEGGASGPEITQLLGLVDQGHVYRVLRRCGVKARAYGSNATASDTQLLAEIVRQYVVHQQPISVICRVTGKARDTVRRALIDAGVYDPNRTYPKHKRLRKKHSEEGRTVAVLRQQISILLDELVSRDKIIAELDDFGEVSPTRRSISKTTYRQARREVETQGAPT